MMITLDMVKELNVMVAHGMIEPSIAWDAIAYIAHADVDEIDEFESMTTTEAVDMVIEIVKGAC